MSATFDEILRAWRLSYDDRLPKHSRERRLCLIELIGNLADHGITKDNLNTSKRDKIVNLFVNSNYKDKAALKEWIRCVAKDWEAALLIYYGTVPIRKDVVTPEMMAKVDSLELKAIEARTKTSTNTTPTESRTVESSPDLINLTLTESENLSEIQAALSNNVSQLIPQPKEFEITDEMLDSMDGPEIIYDTDFYKKLGIDNE